MLNVAQINGSHIEDLTEKLSGVRSLIENFENKKLALQEEMCVAEAIVISAKMKEKLITDKLAELH